MPPLQARVNDYASILSADERKVLEETLAAYENETTHQIAVLTISSLNDEAIEVFSLRVANAWALGQRGWDNGILVTVAPTERRVRIELGYGMNRHISNADAMQIIEEAMLPSFAEGQYAKGIRLGVDRLMAAGRAYTLAQKLPLT